MLDNLTGLVWTKYAQMAGGKTWQGAQDFVRDTMNTTWTYCGFTDWRLPNVNELESLVYAGNNTSAQWLMNHGGFMEVQESTYWSFTTDASYGGQYAWVVDMGNRGDG